VGNQRKFQASFQAGEVSEGFLRRADSALIEASCKRFRNAILNAGGGWSRRPGTALQAFLSGLASDPTRLFRYAGDGFVEDLIFVENEMRVYASDGTLNQTLTGLTWDEADLANAQFASSNNQVFIVSSGFAPQVASRASDGTWSVAALTFDAGFGAEIQAPFYRHAPAGVTMTLSQYTGSGATMTFSEDVLDASYVGVRFRYLAQTQVEVTAVTDARTATVTIHGTCYPTINCTVLTTESSRFKVGQIVRTETTNVAGRVVVASGTLVKIILTEGYTQPTSGEKIIGPEGAATPSAYTQASTPNATTIWDEELFSQTRGYPSTVAVHRSRLYLSGISAEPSLIAASAVNALTNYSVGAEAQDALIELLGDDPNAQVRHVVSAEQLIVLSDRGAYYVPESGDNQITPTSVAFNRIGPEGAALVAPAVTSNGVVFIDDAAGRVMVCVPTGNIRRSWEVIELSENAYHLLSSPKRLAVVTKMGDRAERYILVLNTDGTLAVAMYRRSEETIGWGLWSRGAGEWVDISEAAGDVRIVARQATTQRLSEFSDSSTTDDEEDYTASTTSRINLPSHIVQSNEVIDAGTADGFGILSTTAVASGLTIGYDFALDVTPYPPMIAQIGVRRMRIPRFDLEVLNSGAVRVAAFLYTQYQGGDDIGTPGTTRTRLVTGYTLGWSDEPTLPITQDIGEGCALEVRSLTYEVAF